ncbi:MAG TPA: putative sulfate exporter family transporter [Acidobacteriaceae bacterium]|jgi:uncharacterized integral membrane protein (TIGR00698 family)
MRLNPTICFIAGLILAASGLFSPPIALLAGLAFGLTFAEHPLGKQNHCVTKFLLQAAVVLLGFLMNLGEVLHAGRSGFVYTAISIVFAMSLGLALGRLMHVQPKASLLITCGTAICGGSAIAAIAPVSDADQNETAISLATVFTLNAVALLIFPPIGWALHLSQSQFGLWAALAIHDTSSVVGAAAKYGQQALEIGTTVKLARALWIVPLTLVVASLVRRSHTRSEAADAEGDCPPRKAKIAIPWFIGLFVIAAVLRTYLPNDAALWNKLGGLGKTGLTAVLFLIGTGLSRATLRNVGWRPMLQGILLWLVIGSASLFAIHAGWISI